MTLITGPTIERGRRCQNCVHFDNGEKTVKSYKMKRFNEIQRKAAQILEREGKAVTKTNSTLKNDPALLGSNYEYGDRCIRAGVLGTCERNMAPGDFVHAFYLCEAWSGRVRPDGAEKPDELPAEARARIFGDDDAD